MYFGSSEGRFLCAYAQSELESMYVLINKGGKEVSSWKPGVCCGSDDEFLGWNHSGSSGNWWLGRRLHGFSFVHMFFLDFNESLSIFPKQFALLQNGIQLFLVCFSQFSFIFALSCLLREKMNPKEGIFSSQNIGFLLVTIQNNHQRNKVSCPRTAIKHASKMSPPPIGLDFASRFPQKSEMRWKIQILWIPNGLDRRDLTSHTLNVWLSFWALVACWLYGIYRGVSLECVHMYDSLNVFHY